MHRNGYEVVNHTKTQCEKRKLILTPAAKKYIQMAIERNEKDVFDASKNVTKCNQFTNQNKKVSSTHQLP